MTKNAEWLKLRLSIILSMITILVPILYLIGYSYHLGKLETFGAEIEFYPKPIQDYFISAFFIFLHSGNELIKLVSGNKIFIFVFIVGTLFIFICASIVWDKNREKIAQLDVKAENFRETNHSEFLKQPVFFILFSLLSLLLFLLVLLIGMVLFYGSYKVGGNYAKNHLENFVACEDIDNSCTFIYEGKEKQLEGIFVAKSDKYIAIWNGEETIDYPLNSTTIIKRKVSKKP